MDSRGRPPPSRCYAQLHPCSATSVLVLVVTLSVQLLPTISIPMAATAINSTTKSSTITNSPLPSPTYTYLSYAQIHHRLVLLSTIFPRLMRLYSAQDRFSLPHVGNCSQIPVTDADLQPFLDDRYASSTTPTPLPTIVPPDSLARPAPCTVWVVELTNFDNLPINPARPQWFVSGELHGDEVIGPIAVLAFIEWMIAHYPYDPFAKRMVDTRVSVLVPMANPVGYFQGVRDEVQQQQQQQQQPRTYDHGDEDNDDTDIAGESGEVHLQFDPNRDFAFDNDPESCMQTVAARALNELYRVNLFRVAVTFHAGTNALSYEWGDTTHCEDQNCHPAPDTRIMAALADRMSANAGSAGPFEDAYPVGDMGSLVYSVRGGMEDWSYAASWASPAVVCATTTLGGYPASKTAVNGATNRAVTFLVEMSQDKRPDEHTLGSSYQVAVRGAQGDGHVPRNVRLLFSVVDAIEPYIIVNETDTYLRQRQVSWTVGGAFLVDATTVQWGIMSNGTQSRATPPSSSPAKNGTAGLPIVGGTPTVFTTALPSGYPRSVDEPIFFRAVTIVDQMYAQQHADSVPQVQPQSHLMGARASDVWSFSVDGRQLVGQQVFFSETYKIHLVESGGLSQSVVEDAKWDDSAEHALYSPDASQAFPETAVPLASG